MRSPRCWTSGMAAPRWPRSWPRSWAICCLQVYLQAQVAHDEDLFHIGDVYQAITEKLIRRHPHVFGEVEARDAAQVLRNWETMKKAERAARGEEVASESVLRGIPKSAPALYQAYELSKKAAKAGFEWPTDEGAVEKVAEEARELVAAVASGDRERRARGTGRRPLYPCGGGTQTRPGAGARAARREPALPAALHVDGGASQPRRTRAGDVEHRGVASLVGRRQEGAG